MMAQSDNDWIPLDQAARDCLEDDKRYWVTAVDAEGQLQVSWGYGLTIRLSTNIIAVKPKECVPEPYALPKPVRRQWWIVEMSHNENDDAYRVEQCPVSSQLPDRIHVREVLAGDPSPEVIEKVVARLRELVDQRTGATPYLMQQLADQLEGKQ